LLDSLNNKLLYFTREKGTGDASDTVFSITPALIDNEGKVTQSVLQKKILTLNRDEIEKLKRMKKAIVRVVYSTTNGRKVLLRANDKIRVRLTSSVSLRVGE
jgi:ribosomal protein L34